MLVLCTARNVCSFVLKVGPQTAVAIVLDQGLIHHGGMAVSDPVSPQRVDKFADVHVIYCVQE